MACGLIVEQGLSSALIVEDDVILPDDIDQILDSLESEIRQDDVISIYNRTMSIEKFSSFNAIEVGKRQIVCPLEARVMRTAAAYVIGKKTAEGISRINNPVKYVADDWQAFYEIGAVSRYRLLHPIPVKLWPFVSTLSYDSTSTAHSLIRHALSLIPFNQQLRQFRRAMIVKRREKNIRIVDEPSKFSL